MYIGDLSFASPQRTQRSVEIRWASVFLPTIYTLAWLDCSDWWAQKDLPYDTTLICVICG